MNDVINFIKRRFSQDCRWLDGNCYYFSIILQNRFPNGEIIYEPVDGHFLYKIDDYCYDFLGQHPLPDFYYCWNKLKQQEPGLYERIKRDCTQ